MKLTNTQLIELNAALAEFDAKTSDGSLRHKIKWTATYAIARSRSALKDHLEAIGKSRAAIIRSFADGKETMSSDHPKFAEAMAEIDALMNAEVEVTNLHRAKVADLLTETNSFPPGMIIRLLPLIEE